MSTQYYRIAATTIGNIYTKKRKTLHIFKEHVKQKKIQSHSPATIDKYVRMSTLRARQTKHQESWYLVIFYYVNLSIMFLIQQNFGHY